MSDTMTESPPTDDLVRRFDDRVIAGVAAAVARRLGIGAGWVRIAFVLLVFVGGLGLLAYGIGWVAIREEGQSKSLLDQSMGGLQGSSAWIGGALMMFAALVLLRGWTGFVRGDMFFAAGLFLVGLLLYRERIPIRPTRPEPPLDEDDDGPPATPQADLDESSSPVGPVATAVETEETSTTQVFPEGGGGDESPPPLVTMEPPPPPSPPPGPRSYLGRLILAGILVTLGVMAIFDNLDVASPALRHYLAAAVLVIGAGLLVGAFMGRARGLIFLGLILLPATMAASAVRVDVFGTYGDPVFIPTSVDELDAEYELSGGELTLDLRQLGELDEPIIVDANVGFGSLEVLVPDDVGFTIDARVGVGYLETNHLQEGVTSSAGFDVTETVNAVAEGDGELLLDLEVGIGAIEIVIP